jgi:uncharacterized protein (TIGR00369 family)
LARTAGAPSTRRVADYTRGMSERVRTISWNDPMTMPGRAAASPGLETLRRVIAGELPATPMARLIDIRLSEADRGRVVFEATPAEFHYNFSGTVHGGFAATLLDSAMACAIYTTLDAGQNCPTLELKINYVRAITSGLGPVRGIGTVIHRGRTTALAEGRVEDRQGRLLAHATTTCLIVSARLQGAGTDA